LLDASTIRVAGDVSSSLAVVESPSISALFEGLIIARSVDLEVARYSGFSLARRLAN
jgi:hypothetical protein